MSLILQTDDDDDNEKEKSVPKPDTEIQNPVSEPESCASEQLDTIRNEEVSQSEVQEIFKQRQFIDKLQRLSNLKRKSDEFLHQNYYTDVLNNTDKRPKTKEKQNQHQTNYDNLRNMYETPVDITSAFNTHIHRTATDDKCKEQLDNSIEMKTECDDSDIIVTDPAVCNDPKTYEGSLEGQKDLSMPLEYQSPQDSK